MAGNKKRRSGMPADNHGEEGDSRAPDDEEEEIAPVEVARVPQGQVQLTEEKLIEVFTKTITAADPNVPKKKTCFDYTEGEFVHVGLTGADHLKVHFFMEGDLILQDSDAARDQEALSAMLEAKAKIEEANSDGQASEGADDGEYPADVLSGKLALKNQFNFSERATQTFNNPKRTKGICTEPPPKKNYSAQISRWEIHDAYLKDFDTKALEASITENKKVKVGSKKDGEETETSLATVTDTVETKDADAVVFASEAMARSMQLMERMVHTNSEAEAFNDFKYFEDKSEAKREDGRGNFLPLWRFVYDKAQRKTVSSICWNPEYTTLFAVGYGSYEFNKQVSGLICCYSLKNTSYPEYSYETESGVMCLDFHPQHSSLLCVGLYNGGVVVYDVRKGETVPVFEPESPESKHTDPVWQVSWNVQKEGDDSPLSFHSVSSDGFVKRWILKKNNMMSETVIQVQLEVPPMDTNEEEGETGPTKAPEPSQLVGLAGACCFDFNGNDANPLFVVGTEEGAINSYTNSYTCQHQRTYDGHRMSVYTVKWNPFHHGVFLSCSADWTVKLWDSNCSTPICTFDLGTSVSDVAWSPYSSTVLAVITADGKVRVYDLNVNKHEPVGETRVNKKAKLTHIAFNPIEPIVCVGDDRGVVQVLKLSTNLRKMSATKREEVLIENEIAKLDQVMIVPEDEKEEDIGALLEKAIQA